MHVHLRSSALLAMTKLMAIDPAFCEANLPLLFTLLEKRLARPSHHACRGHDLQQSTTRFSMHYQPQVAWLGWKDMQMLLTV